MLTEKKLKRNKLPEKNMIAKIMIKKQKKIVLAKYFFLIKTEFSFY